MNGLLNNTNPRDIIIQQAKNVATSTKNVVKTLEQDVLSQTLGMEPHYDQPKVKLPVEQASITTKDVVKGFYEPSKGNEILEEMKPEHKQAMITQQKAKDEHDIASTRQKIQAHFQQNMQQYWKPTFEEHPKIEEHKEEQEKRQEEAEEQQMKELKEDQKQKEDISLRRAQTSAENKMGAVG